MYSILSSIWYRFISNKDAKTTMGTALDQLGLNTASEAIGGAMGIVLGHFNDKRQLKQNEALIEQQIAGQKEMANYNQMLQHQMWNATNYAQQIKQLQAAGLNPGLIYGMGGAGGATTGSPGGSVNTSTAPTGGGEPTALAGMGLQNAMSLQLMQQQKELMEAQTQKTNAEATKISGVDTTESQTRIDNLLQGIDNARQQYEIQKLEITLKNIENFEKQASQNDRLDYIKYQTRMALKQLNIAENEAFISSQTYQQKIDIIRQQAIGSVIQNELLKQNIQASKAQVEKWAQEISQGWEQLDQNAQRIKLEKFNSEIKANFPSMGDALGRILNDGIESIFKLTDQNRGQHYHTPGGTNK